MEKEKEKVKVVEQCRVSPPSISSVPPTPTSLPLSFLDLRWLCVPPVQYLFFYEFQYPLTHFMDTILPNIKHTLSLTLQQFFPLIGNLTWPLESNKPQILYNIHGDSVPLTVAESNQNFNHLLGNHPRDACEFCPLVLDLLPSNDHHHPLLALQITVFPNSGISVGVTISHAVADGHTIINFIKYWASACKLGGGGEDQEGTSLMAAGSLPFYDRSVIEDPNGMFEMNSLNNLKKRNISQQCFQLSYTTSPAAILINKVRATFVMGVPDLERLKLWVVNRLKMPPSHLSKFVLTCAYVWVCLIKSRDIIGKDEESKEKGREFLTFTIECRSRLDPPLPKTYFGNCIIPCYLYVKLEDLIGEDGIAIAAEAIGNRIRRLLDDGVLIGAEKQLSSADTPLISDRFFTVAGSPKFGVYETDFGWGRPKKVEITSVKDDGAMSLSERGDGEEGLEIGLVRHKLQMDAFASLFENTLKNLL